MYSTIPGFETRSSELDIEVFPTLFQENEISVYLKSFMNKVEAALKFYVMNENSDKLYLLSDKTMDCERFHRYFKSVIGNKFRESMTSERDMIKWNIDLSIERSKSSFNQILLGLDVTYWHLVDNIRHDMGREDRTLNLKKFELLFTYRNDDVDISKNFKIVTYFKPPVSIEI